MPEQAQAGGQASPQGQGGQAPQSGQGAGQQQQSLSEQVFGQAPSQQQQGSEGTQAQLLPGQKQGESPEAFAARVNSELERARTEAGRYRTELRKYQGDPQQGEDGLTEFQRLQRQNEAITKQLTELAQARKADKMQAQLVTALANAGAVQPELSMALLKIPDEAIADDGTIDEASVLGAMAELKAKMPQIFTDTRGNGDGPAGGGGGGLDRSQDMNWQIRNRVRPGLVGS